MTVQLPMYTSVNPARKELFAQNRRTIDLIPPTHVFWTYLPKAAEACR